ncbi:NUDIX domain-containing protein [Auraticoccus sp. F435]|uniref:NUDIX domain-containing protein n=2 Tax=Auraticoccus cholistanensis TaxID=2656650 RepID=A0A6A9UY31_9ACTN|nr:NUDIX domain-containing protein [Auraticoccus cholistanensis]MVA76672.1 NUDIX domain-containing protein [Auraticoccus cholistanensis]
MDIVGRSAAGLDVVYRHHLDHGEDPRQGAIRRGWQVERALSATQGEDGLELTLLVSPLPRGERPRRNGHQRLRPADAARDAEVRQRPAAYAIAVCDSAVLATEFSSRTGVPGQWGLPGGGIEPGEDPADTVVRETWEEAGQRLSAPVLIDVQSDHWVGHAPNGVLEDFHAIRLIYAARCPEPGAAVVHDVGGTTSAAQWVPLDSWTSVPWTRGARSLLQRHLDSCVRGLALDASCRTES